MAALCDFEGFVREKIVESKYTYKQLSDTLQQCFPEERGFSVRSIKRFCNEKEIRKTTKLDDQELDEVVIEAVLQVCQNPFSENFKLHYESDSLQCLFVLYSAVCGLVTW